MLTHIVLFKLKDRSPENIDRARAKLASLAGRIETLRSIEVGADVIRAGRSYDLALIARFDDMAGYQAYQEHPVHLPVIAYMVEASESIVAVDFEGES